MDWLRSMMILMAPEDGGEAGGGGTPGDGDKQDVAPDAKPDGVADDKSKDGGEKDGGKAESQEPTGASAPEKYELKWSASDTEMDAGFLEALSPALKEAGLTNKQAQALADAYEEHTTAQAAASEEAQAKADVEEVKADETYGGDKFEKSVERAKNVIARIFPAEFQTFLDESGLGNKLQMVRMGNIIADAISEDKLGAPGQHGPKPSAKVARADELRKMYPSMHKEAS